MMQRTVSTILIVLLSSALCAVTVSAAVPVKSYMELMDGRHVYVKTFEASPGDDPALLEESPFTLDGFSYSYYETARDEVTATATRTESREVSAVTESNSTEEIMPLFAPEIPYTGTDGFAGTLLLDNSTMKTEVEGYTAKSYTLTDTLTLSGLGSNDPSMIPKSTVKNGTTLSLQDIDWIAESADAIDYNSIPTRYKAVAHYSGAYSKNIPTGYVTTAEYKGEVSKTEVEKIIYTLTYLGTELPKPTPKPTPTATPEPKAEQDEKQDEGGFTLSWIIFFAVLCLAIVGGLLFAFMRYFFNTFVYIKDGDEHELIARRRIKWSNPVLDLSRLDVLGKEVAVHVKRNLASRLFGRHIKTLADGDYSVRCLVDKQDSDFWYAVKIPDTAAETEIEGTE